VTGSACPLLFFIGPGERQVIFYGINLLLKQIAAETFRKSCNPRFVVIDRSHPMSEPFAFFSSAVTITCAEHVIRWLDLQSQWMAEKVITNVKQHRRLYQINARSLELSPSTQIMKSAYLLMGSSRLDEGEHRFAARFRKSFGPGVNPVRGLTGLGLSTR
jgi:hypothetical protein